MNVDTSQKDCGCAGHNAHKKHISPVAEVTESQKNRVVEGSPKSTGICFNHIGNGSLATERRRRGIFT
jgi:hypothetical protein